MGPWSRHPPVSFEITPDETAVGLYAPTRLRRSPITGVRDALSGYQDGRRAYCNDLFTDIGTKRVAVDHVLPFVLMTRGWPDGDLHQIWNLVLACYECNSAKRDLPPDKEWMCWLEERNEHLITSHHPLRETLITQLGPNATRRREALVPRHTAATEMIRSTWKPFISPLNASITLSTWVGYGRRMPLEVAASVHGETGDAAAGQDVRLAHDAGQRPEQCARKRHPPSFIGPAVPGQAGRPYRDRPLE